MDSSIARRVRLQKGPSSDRRASVRVPLLGDQFEVVHSLEEAYETGGARPEDFTVCLLLERLAA
jgi:hypothetical protein